jgi:hypothetical protein
MPRSTSWIERAVAAWRDAEQTSDRVDEFVELFFTTLIMEARGDRKRREAMSGEVAVAEVQPAWLYKLLAAATNAVTTWCAGDFVAAARAFAKLVLVAQKTGKSQTLAREAFVVHALTWQAACETREERLELAGRLLDEAERRLGDSSWPNCRGWLHAEQQFSTA